jgi:hypothetical protein
MPDAKCGNCRFWEMFPDPNGPGVCRRHAPRPKMTASMSVTKTTATWPITHDDDWCGEYESDERPGSPPAPAG